MEKSKKYFALTALVMCLVCQASNLFAQDEKKIWTACIDSIYHHKATLVIYPHMQEPINPVNPVIDTTDSQIEKISFVFYVDTKLLEIGEDLIPYRLDGLLQSKSIKLSAFNKLGKADSLEVDTTAFDFSCKLYNRVRDKAIHDSFRSRSPHITAGQPEAMAFSKIMFTRDGKSAIVYSLLRNWGPRVFAFLLEKNKGDWRVKKIEYRYYR